MRKFFFHFNTFIPFLMWFLGVVDFIAENYDKAAMNFALGCFTILVPIWLDYRKKEYDNEF